MNLTGLYFYTYIKVKNIGLQPMIKMINVAISLQIII